KDKYKSEDINAIFVRTYTKVNKEFLDRFPNVHYALRAGVGLDNIDVKECERRDIKVINAPGSNANAVAEYVVGSLILMLRNIIPQNERLKKGHWRDRELIGEELAGKVIGLVGCGAVAQSLAKKLQGFDVDKIIGYDPFMSKEVLKKTGITKAELEEIIKKADIISLHVPLLPQTKHIFASKELKKMKNNAILVNTSRGGIVNEANLIQALREGEIKGAILDVFENEPEIRGEFEELKNVFITPHIAGLSRQAEKEMSVSPVKRLLNIA
ncbi:MAG: phosphoglycerate dehydrogenase, partial [Candidatus Levybacteria bacterium CG10_big_fil_rev_8_21_14_0_10_36_7]